MTLGDADIWVCGQCRSVNKLRAKQCYNCRTPKDRAEVDPAAIEGTGHGQLREIALPEFTSSRGAAMLATVLILFVAIMQVITTIARARLANSMLSQLEDLIDPGATMPPGLEAEVVATASLGLVSIGIAVLGLAAWAYWLSRVVSAMPALGLGYPAANALMAFVENFLPGLNLIRVPAIVRDVVRRLEPGQGRGEALIFAAWIGLIGGFVVPRLWGVFGGFGAESLEQLVRSGVLVEGVSTGLVLIGAIFLVVLIWWIEGRIARRRAEQLGELAPAAAESGSATAGPEWAAAVAGPEVATVEPRVSTPVGTPIPYDPTASPFAPARQTVATPEPVVRPGPFVPTPGASVPDTGPMVAGPLGAVAAVPTTPTTATMPSAPTTPTAPTTAEMLHRPITAVTGAASIPSEEHIARPRDETPDVERFADARPAWPEPPAAAAAPATPVAPEMPAPPVAPEPPAAVPTSAEPAPFAPAAPEPFAPAEPAPFAPAAPAPSAVPSPAHAPTGPRLHIRVNSATTMIATLDGESEPISIKELPAAADALARADGSAVVAATPTNFDARRLAQQVFELLSAAHVPTTMED